MCISSMGNDEINKQLSSVVSKVVSEGYDKKHVVTSERNFKQLRFYSECGDAMEELRCTKCQFISVCALKNPKVKMLSKAEKDTWLKPFLENKHIGSGCCE